MTKQQLNQLIKNIGGSHDIQYIYKYENNKFLPFINKSVEFNIPQFEDILDGTINIGIDLYKAVDDSLGYEIKMFFECYESMDEYQHRVDIFEEYQVYAEEFRKYLFSCAVDHLSKVPLKTGNHSCYIGLCIGYPEELELMNIMHIDNIIPKFNPSIKMDVVEYYKYLMDIEIFLVFDGY